MTTRALPLARARAVPGTWPAGVAATALALGAASAWDARVALALVVVLALGAACLVHPATILVAMIAAVFVEVVSLGGIPVSHLVAPAALLVLVVALVRGSAAVRFSAPLGWALAYSIWALASGLWTVSAGSTAVELASLAIAVVYLLAFAGMVSTEAELERVLLAVAVSALAIALVAVVAFAAGGTRDLEEGRAAGGAGDPNFFAAYQLVAIPLVLVLASDTRRRRLRLGLYASALVLVASVLTTLSRGGLVALAAITVLAVVLPARTSMFSSRFQKGMVVLAVCVGAAIGFRVVAGTFAPRLESMLSQGGGSGRLILWQGAWTAVERHPLTGLGYGGYQPASNDLIYATPGVSLSDYDLHPDGQPAHNAYLGTAAELGFPGLLLFVALLVSTGRSLRRTAARARAAHDWRLARVASALTISLAGWAVSSLFLSSETSRPLWILVGLTLALPKLVGVPTIMPGE